MKKKNYFTDVAKKNIHLKRKFRIFHILMFI